MYGLWDYFQNISVGGKLFINSIADSLGTQDKSILVVFGWLRGSYCNQYVASCGTQL